jgi:hypothetical protein
MLKTSPPDKWAKAPAVIKHENDLFHETCDATVKKYAGVQIVSTPYITTRKFRDNYDSIFRKA